MELTEWIVFTLMFIGFILGLVYIIYSKFTDKKFKVLEQLFIEKFGYAPLNMTFGKSAGIFFVGLRDQIFTASLMPSWINRKLVKPEEKKFIQSLPKELTNWVKIKYRLARCSALLLFISFLLAWFFGYM